MLDVLAEPAAADGVGVAAAAAAEEVALSGVAVTVLVGTTVPGGPTVRVRTTVLVRATMGEALDVRVGAVGVAERDSGERVIDRVGLAVSMEDCAVAGPVAELDRAGNVRTRTRHAAG